MPIDVDCTQRGLDSRCARIEIGRTSGYSIVFLRCKPWRMISSGDINSAPMIISPNRSTMSITADQGDLSTRNPSWRSKCRSDLGKYHFSPRLPGTFCERKRVQTFHRKENELLKMLAEYKNDLLPGKPFKEDLETLLISMAQHGCYVPNSANTWKGSELEIVNIRQRVRAGRTG